MQKKTKLYKKARELRYRGKSYSEIQKEVEVARSTLSLWLRDIKLSDEQMVELKGRRRSSFLASKKRQKNRINLTKKIVRDAKMEAKKRLDDNLFVIGTMLYWAEGTKRGGEMVNLSNSDPSMIKIMMMWFRKICLVPEEKFKIQIHIHTLNKTKDIKNYWSKITGVSLNQFHNLIIKKTSLGHRKNKLYNGTCCIRVYDVNLFRKIMGWRIGILETYNIEDYYDIPIKKRPCSSMDRTGPF